VSTSVIGQRPILGDARVSQQDWAANDARCDALGWRPSEQTPAVHDPRGNRTSFTYDDAGRLYTQTDPLNYVTTYLYDAAGRNTILVDANGAVKTTVYDAAGRVVSLLYADGKRVTFQYDAVGRRTTMVDWDGTTTYAYSARGELTGKTEPTGLRMTMLYDSVGNRTTLTEPDGYSYTFGYDAVNRPIRLRNPNAYVYTFQYDAAGRRTTLLDSTGITRAYQYDPVGRLTTQVDSNSGGTALVTFVDSYDSVGNRAGRNHNGVVTTWVYDSVYRLTGQEKSGQAATFVYDPAGNMTVKHHEGSNPLTMSYDAANRLTTSLQGTSQLTTYGFDNNGNLTSEHCSALSVALTWTYDGENRCLNELRGSGENHTYTYAPDGLRRSAHHGGAANPVSFVWDGDDLLNEYRLGGVSCRYDVLDGEVFGEKRGANRYLHLPDPLGSVVNLLDTSQSIAGTYTYWPYGEVQSHTGATTPMQFLGALGYQSQIVNRVYDKAGYYRPDTGQQTQMPSGNARDCELQADRLWSACEQRLEQYIHRICDDPHQTIACLPDCPESSPWLHQCYEPRQYRYCPWAGRAGSCGRSLNFSWCKVECMVRACCSLRKPGELFLGNWRRRERERCRHIAGYSPKDPCVSPAMVALFRRCPSPRSGRRSVEEWRDIERTYIGLL